VTPFKFDRTQVAKSRTATTQIVEAFDAEENVVTRRTTGESSAWRYEGVIENSGGVTAFIGAPIKTTLGEDDAVWDTIVVANDGGDALQITDLSNQSSDEVRFVATVRTVEVAW